jgi:arylsulfatase A-like enzyme
LADPKTDEQPNIVFVFADDWGWGDLACYGHPKIRTPNLDRLASQGTIYTNFHVCSGVCSPSRAAVLTSRFPGALGIHGHFASHESNARRGMPNWLDPDLPTYMSLLQDAGYRTAHFGKWHLGKGEGAPEPFAYGIDECCINVGNGPQLEFGSDNQYQPGQRSRSSEVIVDHTIDFIQRHRDQPFAVNVWLNDTHATLDPDEQQLAAYPELRPDNVGERWPRAPAIYYSVVTNADKHIGRLMDRLDELNLTNNTIFIFSADNGPEDIHIRNASHSGVGSAGPFRGRKRSLYEGGTRVPFILRWPGRTPAGAVDNDTPLCAIDLLPTFCDIAGAGGVPTNIDGEVMTDVFTGTPRRRETPLFWEVRFGNGHHVVDRSPMLAVLDGRWKLLCNADRSRIELYDYLNDPTELTNLAATHPDVAETLFEKVTQWQATLPEGPRAEHAGSNHYPWPQPANG